MKKFIFLAMFSMGMLTATADTIYVTQTGGTTLKDGEDWLTAFDNLQQAINAAQSGDQIWVAAGSYTPTSSGGRVSFSINTKTNIAIYGGFAGGELSLSARPSGSRSILNGDDDNVFYIENSTVTLDGFEIQNGTGVVGGGIYHVSGNLTLNNVIIQNNNATWGGGGIYFGSGYLNIAHTQIINNGSSNCSGGGIYIEEGYTTLSNTLIADNTASNGGGIYISSSALLTYLNNVTIANNTASSGSAIYSATNAVIKVLYSIVKGGFQRNGTLAQNYSIVEGVNTTTNNNLPGTTDPLFMDTANGNYRLRYNSPCIDIRDGGSGTDLDGNPRPFGTKFDMGAYEYTIKPSTDGIVRVKKSVSGGSQDGSSWANAIPELAPAIYYASIVGSFHEIWVAANLTQYVFPVNP